MIDETKKNIEMDVADILMERPRGFNVGEHRFYLYPMTLGKSYLVARLIESLEINSEIIKENHYMEALRLCKEKTEVVCQLISYHTFNTREELFDYASIKSRSDFFSLNLSYEEMAQLLIMILAEGNVSVFIKHFGIDRERKELERISKIKGKNSNSISFGGKSVFGSLILPACVKLNMTPRQVVWDISYSFLQMLMADAITPVYLTDEEIKGNHISTDREFISADDPRNKDIIRSMKWD